MSSVTPSPSPAPAPARPFLAFLAGLLNSPVVQELIQAMIAGLLVPKSSDPSAVSARGPEADEFARNLADAFRFYARYAIGYVNDAIAGYQVNARRTASSLGDGAPAPAPTPDLNAMAAAFSSAVSAYVSAQAQNAADQQSLTLLNAALASDATNVSTTQGNALSLLTALQTALAA